MGRRRLLPNINSLLLQLHLPHRSGSSDSDSSTKNETSDHHHHHVFHWPSLKRKPVTSSSPDDEEDLEDDNDEKGQHHRVVYVDLPFSEPPTSHKTLSGSSHSCSQHSTKSAVSFGTCEIRTYPQVLGDHPCCSEGCPIQLGWSYVTEESIRIDDYELLGSHGSNNEQHHNHHTVLQELRLTPEERRSILILSKQKLRDCSNIEPVSHNMALAEGGDGALASDDCGAPIPSSASTNGEESSSDQQHERELIRECRRLHRCGGWNVNVKASRKRNKRTQEAFFGTPKEQQRRRPTGQCGGVEEKMSL